MIYLSENEFGEMKEYVKPDHLIADLITQLYEEIQSNERVLVHRKKELEKAQKKIKSLEKKLGMWKTLKE